MRARTLFQSFVWVFCLFMPPAHLRAEDIPDSPPFPHPVCFKLLVGSTVAGPIADAINLESCTAWADIMPAADWNYENKTHSHYRNDNSDELPGGYAGYTVGGWNPDGAYVIRTFDTGGGNGFHTAFLVAAEEFGIFLQCTPASSETGVMVNSNMAGPMRMERTVSRWPRHRKRS